MLALDDTEAELSIIEDQHDTLTVAHKALSDEHIVATANINSLRTAIDMVGQAAKVSAQAEAIALKDLRTLQAHILTLDAEREAKAIDVARQVSADEIAKVRAIHAINEAIVQAFHTVGLNPENYTSYYDLSMSGRLNDVIYYTNAYLGNAHPLRTVQDLIEYLTPLYVDILRIT